MQSLYDVSPIFSKAGPMGELEGAAGSRLRAAPLEFRFRRLSKV